MLPLNTDMQQFCFPDGWDVFPIHQALTHPQVPISVESSDSYYTTPYDPREKQSTKPKDRKISARTRNHNHLRLDPPGKCPDCDMTTAWRPSLARHFKKKHHGPYKDEPSVSRSGTQTLGIAGRLIESTSRPKGRHVVRATLSSDSRILIYFKKTHSRSSYDKNRKCICADCQ